MKRVLIREEMCMGCGLCEVHCKVHHSQTRDIIKAYKRERPPPLSRIRVVEARPISFAIQCRHCEDAPCVYACLSGAMRLNEERRLVVHDAEKCIGCWTCIMVCPYSALRMDRERQTVVKCDMCPGIEVPACVSNCPNEALIYREVSL